MKRLLTVPQVDVGVLVLRVGLGVMFVLHGWPKITGGSEMWERIGAVMGNFGVTFAPAFWGFMAAAAEFGGGLCLILGLLTKPAASMMAFTMFVATMTHYSNGDPFMQTTSRPLELLFAFVALIFLGGGKYSVDRRLFGGSGSGRVER